ncbi:MAG: hypothetical protein AAB451_02985 [Patescibacteria group bacterium]
MKDKKYLYPGLTAIFISLILVLGWVYFVYGTTIGTNVSTADLTVSGNASTTGTLYANGSITLGDASSDTLTVNATTTFASTTTFNGIVTIGDAGDTVIINSSDWGIGVTGNMTAIGNITADGTINFTGTNLTLGDAASDNLTVNASTTFATTTAFSGILNANNNITLGDASSDTLTVNATTTFASTTTFNGIVTIGDAGDTVIINSSDWGIGVTGNMTAIGNITADGTINFTGTNLTLGDAASDNLTVNASTTFATTTAFTGNVIFGGGNAISKHISQTLVGVDIPSVGTSTAACLSYSTTTITGVATGDTVIATPKPVASGIETLALTWSGYASTTDVVAIRVCNADYVSAKDPAAQDWRIDIWKH